VELSSSQGDPNPLGLMIADSERDNEEPGVLVVRVIGETGRKAGFASGDILLSIDGQATPSVDAFNSVVAGLPRNRVLPALVERDGSQFYLTINIPE